MKINRREIHAHVDTLDYMTVFLKIEVKDAVTSYNFIHKLGVLALRTGAHCKYIMYNNMRIYGTCN